MYLVYGPKNRPCQWLIFNDPNAITDNRLCSIQQTAAAGLSEVRIDFLGQVAL
jgi:hypothetical protein